MVDGNNFHRVVIYADDASLASMMAPFSAMDSRDVTDLWKSMERYESLSGGRVMAIPHNSNLSNGRMFPDVEFTPALIGVTDSVFKVACGAQSVRAGSVVDRMTILVDCGNLDLWKIAEVKRLCTAFFGILKEVSPETLENRHVPYRPIA